MTCWCLSFTIGGSQFVEVCDIGKWGNICEIDCPENCDTNDCDKADGSCTEGCKPGWKGDKCETGNFDFKSCDLLTCFSL